MRDAGNRTFLAIVRRKPLVVRTDESLEERPSSARQLAEEECLIQRQSRFAASERPADPPRDTRREEPKEENRRGIRQCPRNGYRQQDCRRRGDHRGYPHRFDRHRKFRAAASVIEALAIGFVGGGRIPFEKVSMRNEHPPRGARDRIEVDRRLVGEEGEGQRRLRDVPVGHACRGGEVLERQYLIRFPRQIHDERARRRKQQDRYYHQRPQPGMRKDSPSEQQQQCQRYRDETAPQVVEELPLGKRRQGISHPTLGLAGHER